MNNILMSVSAYDADNGLLVFLVIMGIVVVGCLYDHFVSNRKYYMRKRDDDKLRRQVNRFRKERYKQNRHIMNVVKSGHVNCLVKNGDIVTLILESGEIYEYIFSSSEESDEVFFLDNKKVICKEMETFLKENGGKLVKC